MACVFCGIVAGDVAAHRVVVDDVAVAFLDVRPLFEGHLLVVPREHHETLSDLPVDRVGPFFERVRTLQGVVERAMGATGAFIAANNRVSQSVPHLHVHVVPRTKGDGLRGFFWPRLPNPGEERMTEVAAGLAAEYRRALDGGVGVEGDPKGPR